MSSLQSDLEADTSTPFAPVGKISIQKLEFNLSIDTSLTQESCIS
jgi:hypothetical protein